MSAAALPNNEEQRLAALREYDILDTLPEQEFDDLAVLAAQICGTPVSAITLIDSDRQWLKAKTGLDVSETPRDIAFCAHTILQDDVFVIPNAAKDERFAENPLVTGDLHIRFYGGAPLVSPEGHKLGALCVIDRVPRQLLPEQKRALSALSRQVVAQLELRRRLSEVQRIAAERARAEAEVRRAHDELEERVLQRTRELSHSNEELQEEMLRCELIAGELRRARDELELRVRERTSELAQANAALHDEIAERARAEAELRQAHQRLVSHVENSIVGIVEWNPALEILSWSRGAENIFGWRAEEVLGCSARDFHFFYEGDVRVVNAVVERLLSGRQKRISCENRNYTKDGRVVHCQWFNSALYDEAGRLVSVQSLAIDITNRKQAEAELMRSIQERQAILQAFPDFYFRLDEQDKVLEFNAGLESQLFAVSDAFVGRRLPDALPHDVGEAFEKAIARVRAGEALVGIEYALPLVGASGEVEEKHFEARLLPLQGEQIMVLARNITERKESELALRRAEEKYRSIFENAIEGIFQTTPEGRCVSVNPALARLLGYDSPTTLKAEMSDVERQYVDPGRRALFVERMESDGFVSGFESQVYRRDGSIIWISENARCVRDEAGRLLFYEGTIEDVSQHKQIEKMKNEFVSTVSHELRTPLTSIRGSLGLVAGGVAGALPPQARNMVEIAYKNSERLIRLVNDILDTEKIASGKMEFNCQPVLLAPLIEGAIEANKGYGEQFSVHFAFHNAAGDDASIHGDGDRITQVLTNLLSNGAKFSPPGGQVRVTLERIGGNIVGSVVEPGLENVHGTEAGSRLDSRLRVSVADQGAGVPPEFHARLFERFAQADASDTRQKGGTGLGLSICKAIVERMGGTIGFRSQPGSGATFYFDLPEWSAPS